MASFDIFQYQHFLDYVEDYRNLLDVFYNNLLNSIDAMIYLVHM